MKKLKIYLILSQLLINLSVYSNWDWKFLFDTPCDLTIQITTIPFEGLNKEFPNNRVFDPFCGTIFRGYNGNFEHTDYQIVYHKRENTVGPQYFASTFAEIPWDDYDRYGFGKYLITIENLSNPAKNFHFYWNTLDSKCGLESWQNEYYGRDWSFTYSSNPPKVIVGGTGPNPQIYYEILNDYEEVKIWKLLYPNKPDPEEPWEKDFEARTTPFPIHPQLLEDNYEVFKELVLGTTVTLDIVYDNIGGYDIYGYNTVRNFVTILYGTRDYYGNPPIAGTNSYGNTFCTPAYGDFFSPPGSYGMTIRAQAGNRMIIKNNKRLWITGVEDLFNPGNYLGDKIIFEQGSTLEKESTAQINTCFGGKLIDNGANTVWASGSFHQAYANSSLEYYGSQHTVNNGGHIEINGNATLKLGDNTTLIFDGAGTYLTLNSGSNIICGNNAQIKFTNGAYLDANGATFNNPNGYWQGIVFENAGASTNIRNCTFSKATTALKFYYSSSSGLSFPVTNNVFNVTSGRGVEAENLINVTFDDNIFNLSSGTFGAYFHNSTSPEGSGLEPQLVRFTNNTFTGGFIPLFISGFASNIIPVYVYANSFSGSENCFIGRFITGNIKNNNIVRTSGDYAFRLIQSNPNMLYNNITCQNGRAVYFEYSSPMLTSVRDENRVLLIGGINNIEAVNGDAVNLNYANPLIDFGSNWFTISNANYYHIYGRIPGPETIYYARVNCWYGTGHHNYIYNINNLPVSVITEYNSNCPLDMVHISPIVNDMGSGVYDTVWVVEDYIGVPALDDEILYTQASLQQNDGSYFEAITGYKNLINNYEESNYLNTSLYGLYACYEGLDTSDQSHRDLIFSDLKNYLIDKIEQYSENDEFINIAYNLVLMCETRLENYNEAMTGFEFIALYHPDPDQRIWASLDYSAIQDLINGMGGGESNKPKVSKSILKLMDKKPYSKIVKETYLKGTKELEKKLKNENQSKDISIVRSKLLIDRASQNISISRVLSKKQREERRLEDIKLLFPQNPVIENDNTNNIPLKYTLHQNYPNPFNPITTIKYELPREGMITFKIYDILGKEIYSINEFRKAGVHEIKFDGTNLASGVYFYRIEAGSFFATKKMVLIK